MTWPVNATKAALDQGSDDPKQARAELAALVDRFNELLAHFPALMQTFNASANAATARGVLGLGTAATKNTGTSGDAVPVLNGDAAFAGAFALSGTLTPPAITVDQNDYNPAGLTAAVHLRISANATRIITGLATGSPGRLLWITNAGAAGVTLAHESAASGSAARFAFASGAYFTLGAGATIALIHDGASSRWRLLAGGGGRAPDVQLFTADGLWSKPSGFSATARMRIELTGSGGGGGNRTDNGRGAGGAGGVHAAWDVRLADADSDQSVVVGPGGAGAANGASAAGAAGGDTSFTLGALVLTVPGGAGGQQAGSGNTANGGALATVALAETMPVSRWAGTSGTTSTSANAFQVDGVNLGGVPAASHKGGGGGGAAGGGTSIGGNTSQAAGSGGAGNHLAGQPGGNGTAPGGGGGGSSNDGGGGNGARGEVRITVYEP